MPPTTDGDFSSHSPYDSDALPSSLLSDASGKPEKYLTGLADLFPAYSENKPIKNGDHGFKPY